MSPTDIIERVLYAPAVHDRDSWLRSPRDGLRDELIPGWCKKLWGDAGGTLVPARKFGWCDPETGEPVGQPTNHHAECYSMAVLEGRVAPTRWDLVDGRESHPAPAPAWLQPPWFETLYECFTFVGTSPLLTPRRGGIYRYGDSFLDGATLVEGTNQPPATYLRYRRDLQLEAGRATTDPDIIALPRAGGVPIAIEAKTAGGDRMHGDGAQENGLATLAALGFEVEVWWIGSDGAAFRRPRTRVTPAEPIGDGGVVLRACEGVDWDGVRAKALEAAGRG